MSFTLMRYKDGKPAPIKLSIWDAFKGVPPPRPRIHQCSSCNSFHHPKARAESKKPNSSGKTPTSEKKDGTEEGGFTKEEDAKIMKLKADGKIWALIAAEVGGGRHKGDISRRHKQLMAADGAKESDTKLNEKPEKVEKKEVKSSDEKTQEDLSKMSKKERKAAKAKQDREEGLKKREEQKTKDQSDRTKSADTNEKATVDDKTKVPVATNNNTSSSSHDKQKWMTAASKHFDRTGVRITADQARKMVEEKTT